ncbi:PAS domain S-box-containing protein [Massilia sp. PDC64]|nr:GAF domain-containing protein [Massilia sp. PDC64]SDC72264.1 PAS domain S-box-containing protein [Massilia sp. PDC64]
MTHNDTGNVEATLDEVLITHELARRPVRAADHRAESRALTLLSQELVTHPRGVLQRLAELALQLCRAGTAGVSILEPGTHGDVFRWHAMAGAYASLAGATVPRANSPCGVVVERNTTLLFDGPARRFASLRCDGPALLECLLVPWAIDDQPIGTVWVIAHDPERHFDAEDARLLAELSSFAAAAHRVVKALDDAQSATQVDRHLATLRHHVETRTSGSAEAALLSSPAILRPLLELHVAPPGQADLPAALAPVLNRACALAGAAYGRIELDAGPDAARAIVALRTHGAAAGYRNDVVPVARAAATDAPYALPLAAHDGTELGTLRLALARPPAADGSGLLDLLARTAAGAIERHRSHAARRDDERRQAFLLRLNDTLRPLADPRRIQEEAARELRAHLAVDRIGYAADCGDGEHVIVTHADGTSASAFGGRLRYADYGPSLLAALRTGRPVVRPDILSDPELDADARQAHAALGALSVADVPLVKDGRLVAILFAHHGRARAWSDADLAVMQETAERTWAAVERAQAQAEREAAHVELMRQSRFVATTLDALPDFVYAFDRSHRFVYVNRAMEELYGMAAGALVGRSFADLDFPSDLAARLDGHLDTIFRTGVTIQDEVYFTSPTGTSAYFQFRWGPVLAEDGSVEQVVGVSRDTTGRRMLEARLRESEERAAFLLRLSDAMRSLDDADAIETTATRMVAAHLGASRVLIGEFEEGRVHIRRDHVDGVASLAGTYPLPALGVRALAAFERGEPFVVEDTARDPHMDRITRAGWISVGIASHVGVGLYSGGRVAGVFCVHHAAPRHWNAAEVNLVREAAERTWAAIERVRAEQALKEADRRKDEFLATLAHELRNPLAPISNAIQLMRRADNRDAADRLTGIVERQVRQIVKLVDDLMEIARISRGKIELDRHALALADIVRDAVEASRPQVERAGHVLDVTVPDESLVVHGDAVRLTQVLTNLVNNAAKYTDTGGRIELLARREGAAVALRVRDNGRGIPAAQLPHVFDMFAQPHLGNRGDGDGLGIGLAIVRKLVEMHDGTVEAHSAGPGCGSEFVVRLPLLHDTAPDDDAATTCTALAGHRVLVVDDNADAADTLALLLDTHGARARAVYGGPAALAALPGFAPTVVLLDLGMPEMDGFDVARAIRAEGHAHVRIVALTGWGQQADRERTRAAGFDHHLTKPVDLGALAAWLGNG